MRFPFSLTRRMTQYIVWRKLFGPKYFPLVLMLEPLHACNLRCRGCGRIREYADTVSQRMSVVECLDSITECGAPIVSICGGEPLIYPEIVELVDRTLNLGKHIYLCTNGVLLADKLDDFARLSHKNRRTKGRLYWNVHLDGTENAHDAIVEKEGVFAKAVEGIAVAKDAGFYVYTNTTLYRQTSVDELVELCEHLQRLRVDGMMFAPAYGYESIVSQSKEPGTEWYSTQSPELQSDSIFLTREETHTKFREVREKLNRFRMTATPIYLDFLCGERNLSCAAWANPTRNVKGWKGPCYLVTDRHFATYRELIAETDWSKIGPGNDERCEHCLMHCGFEPAAVLFGHRLRDLFRMTVWQLS